MFKFIKHVTFGAAILMVAFAILFVVSNISMNADAAPDDKYKALDTFSQALSLIENSYVENVDQKDVIYGAIKGMLQELDPHSTFYSPEKFKSFQIETKGSFGGLGITISLKDEMLTIISALEDTPAELAGVKSGDVIVMINNEPTSNFSLEDAVSKMRGKPGTKVKITVVRKSEAKPIDFEITRAIIKLKSVKSDIVGNIGYIRLSQFQEQSTNEVKAALESFDKAGVKGIVLDLRNNGGGLLTEAINISSLFLPTDKSVVYTKDRTGQETHYKTKRISYRDNVRPLVVIVNEGSASASEILAGAFQDYERAVVVGTTTFGKASVQSIMEMRDGSAIKLTTARYYTPLGRSIQGVGVIPDITMAAGKIEFSEGSYTIKEKDLSKHLLGENELKDDDIAKDNSSVSKVLPPVTDVQYNTAMQVLKGLMKFNK